MSTTLHAARVLAGGRAEAGWYVTIDGDTIAAVGPEPPPNATVVELGDADLVPGLVDLHSDCWDDRAHPRPTCSLGLDEALVALDTEVISNGITTHLVCVALEDDSVRRRSVDRARRCVEVLEDHEPALRADHRAHVRFEVTGTEIGVARELAQRPVVALLSYMDHTPGLGQYASEEEWRHYYLREGNDPSAVDALLAKRYARREQAEAMRTELAAVAHAAGVALASHDDDSPECVDTAAELGVVISEFPVNASAAKAATALGLHTVMGAPNARRGSSHLEGNLSAREALEAGWLRIVASDYHPPSLLACVYALASASVCSWADAMALVTRNPAQAIGLGDRGELAPGKRADVVAVERRGHVPVVRQTWVAGRPCFG